MKSITTAEKQYDYSIWERLEGLVEIRKAIDPKMSKTTFYRNHRKKFDHILIERKNWWRRRPPACRYFTFRVLLYHYLIENRLL